MVKRSYRIRPPPRPTRPKPSTLPLLPAGPQARSLSKSQLIEKIAVSTELSKRDVRSVMETLTDLGHRELKRSGVFLVPGFAKFVVIKKPATKARKGTNPFTGQEMMFKAKPARKIVRVRPLKPTRDAL
ncbi:HU family DNA-binding protein [Bradyrhizobium sp. 145]|nr:HU family DNA-binding protein [Bradyrhizobium sp. 145]